MASRERTPSFLWSILFAGGLLFVFVGERLMTSGNPRMVTGLGAVMVVIALVLRVLRLKAAKGAERTIERRVLDTYLLGVLGLLLYFVQSDLAQFLFGGKAMEHGWPRLATVFGALWPALIAASLLPMLLVEMAYASVARAERLEAGRVRDALMSGLGLAGAIVFAFAICFVASERDKKIDLSYFRTAKPREATRKIVRALDQPLQVSLFFPPANEVREQVAEYFSDLAHENKALEVASYDHAIDRAKAKELGASGNGIVVISRGGRHESLSIGQELEQARSQLRNLDKEISKRLMQVARPGRTVYLTSGHGERSPAPGGDTDKRATVRELRELMMQQGYQVRDLGAAEGLAADVPQDAAIVLVIGPQKPFAPEEVASLERYLDRGGRLFLAIDPESSLDEKELLQPLGLKFNPVTLANDQAYWARTRQTADRINIATGSYSSHPAVTTLGHLGMRAPMVFVGAGALEELPAKERPKAQITVDFPVRAHPATWNDLDGNYQFDAPKETRKTWNLSAAVVKKNPKPTEEARAIVVADSDAVGDEAVKNLGNAYFVLDGLKWLLGDEALAGEISSEADVPIAHTHKQDVIWFYSTIFLAPALVLGIGSLMMRRRGRNTRKEAK